MKVIIQDNRRYFLRFDKGEDVIALLADFIKTQNISACSFSGIGACSEADLGFYNPFLKQYRQKPYVDEMEITSFSGNGGLVNGEPSIHAHGQFGRNDFSTIGGHVFKLIVSVTCEVFLIKLEGTLTRAKNPEFDLDLLI